MNQSFRIPTSSRFKVLMFALLPYAYVFAALAIIFVPFGLFFQRIISGESLNGAAARIEMVLLVGAALLARAIWVRVPEPEEPILGPQEEPSLFAIIREIERRLSGPKVQGIQFTDQFSISSALIPRLSLIGWPARFYLKIGLPLMNALSPEQFKAALAQELARYGGKQDRFGSWLNARRITWHHLLAALLQRGGWAAWLFSRFFNWYVPRFHSYSLVLTRQHEFVADRAAAEVTTAGVAADALIRKEFGSCLEDKFWDELDTDFPTRAEVYPDVAELLQTAGNDEAENWLASALEEVAHPYGSSPALKDRLAALDQKPRVPLLVEESAAKVYLGDRFSKLTQRLQSAREQKLGWGQKKFPAVTRDIDELRRRSQQPDFDKFESYELGRQLLVQDQAEGVFYMERAMEADSELTASACFHIANYYRRKADVVTASRYSRRSTEHWHVLQKAIAERTQISFVEEFSAHHLFEQELEQLRRELAQQAEIKEAYLVRKDVRYLSEKPLHALGLVFDRPWFGKTIDDLDFTKRLPQTRTNPPELYAFVLDYRQRRVGKLIREVTNSRIYQRD